MLNCNEKKLTGLLKQKGHNAVLHPREGIAPLTLLAKSGKFLKEVGTLSDLIISDRSYPAVVKDQVAAGLTGERSSELDLDAGLDFLSNIFSGFGLPIDKLSLKPAFKKTKKIVFSFANVKEDKVIEIALDKYISAGKADTDAKVFKKKLYKNDLYIITSVFKSDNFSVESFSESDHSVEVDLPKIEGLFSADLDVNYKGESKSATSYKGQKELVFAFRAVRLIYDKQELEDLKNTNIAMRSDVEFDLLKSANGFISMDGASLFQ